MEQLIEDFDLKTFDEQRHSILEFEFVTSSLDNGDELVAPLLDDWHF